MQYSKKLTVIYFYSLSGKENMVSLLCDNGANVEARTRDGLTPLHCAARSGHERVVEALLDRGAPITSKSKVLFGRFLSSKHSL